MRKSKPKPRRKAPKRVLALPDLEQSKAAVLNSLSSVSTLVFFGATVRYANAAGTERAVSVDEVDLDRNHISWMSLSASRDKRTKNSPRTTPTLMIGS